MAGLVLRMKKHIQKCVPSENSQLPMSTIYDSESNEDLTLDEISKAQKYSRDAYPDNNTESMSASASALTIAVIDSDSTLCINDSDVVMTPKRPKPSTSKSSISSFVIRTSQSEKNELDLQIARCLYATNTSLRAVEHPEFKKMINALRPGYKPPNRNSVSTDLLDKVHNSVQTTIKENLCNKKVCLALYGWSNVHNEPIISVCVTDIESERVHLIESIDTSGNSHTSEYLLQLLKNSIMKCEEYNCKVTSIVTDNAANVTKMRRDLFEELDRKDIITYKE
ncbi:uncharacterized protein LOC108915890 [Anoplophora glabripennis]|uniref:uncharacterized protein LOC108915890 n=1 Tax=Anoplophora glabripennis TaxID=217634 RepID=UPI00087360B3|nr:uncharacterized protein LOC108915890 [Anoplophora glabripennis]